MAENLTLEPGSPSMTSTVMLGDQPTPLRLAAAGVDAGFDCDLTVDGQLFLGKWLYLGDIPTSDPGSPGAVWSDGGTLKISAGP